MSKKNTYKYKKGKAKEYFQATSIVMLIIICLIIIAAYFALPIWLFADGLITNLEAMDIYGQGFIDSATLSWNQYLMIVDHSMYIKICFEISVGVTWFMLNIVAVLCMWIKNQ